MSDEWEADFEDGSFTFMMACALWYPRAVADEPFPNLDHHIARAREQREIREARGW